MTKDILSEIELNDYDTKAMSRKSILKEIAKDLGHEHLKLEEILTASETEIKQLSKKII